MKRLALIAARHKHHLKSQDMARLLGISLSLYSAWEVGRRKPSFAMAERISELLGVPAKDLFADLLTREPDDQAAADEDMGG